MGRRSKNRPPKRPQIAVPEFPTVDNCDPNDPEQFAVWALVGLPGQNGAPLPLPVTILRLVSRRLWDLGFRYHPELRTLKYRKPTTDNPNWLTSPGEWVPIDAEDEPDDGLSPRAQALLEELQRRKAEALAAKAPALVVPDADGKVPYLRADGQTVMVTPAQAARYAGAKRDLRKAQGGES
ncbi:hypothetical protein SEA_CLOWN_36 [Gordonia phage Clown]|uniref:Minor tail protein n=1 Tax=Gordonia phage Clown TaxID=2759393 RepID=A0A7L7SPZ2_9CAUD|nr:minor tail protein [Gordonia phage Clown]QOC56034.1 hypothetical protein SEA_CLOWN_36 [Gordonia phage Clown]